MDYDAYRKAYFAHPPPSPRFSFAGVNGISLYIHDYERALAFYELVLGPPAYKEGEATHGWPLGNAWLTLFPSAQGGPANMDVTIEMTSPEEVAGLYQALINAGAEGSPPSDQLMYERVRYASVTDPFGTVIVIICYLEKEKK